MSQGQPLPRTFTPHPGQGPTTGGGPPEPDPEILATIFFFTLFVTVIGAFSYLMWPFLTDALLAFLLSVFAAPLYQTLLFRVRDKKWIASGLSCAAILLLLSIPITFLISSLSTEARHAIDVTKTSVTAEKVEEFLFGGSKTAETLRRIGEITGAKITPQSVREAVSDVSGRVIAIVYDQLNNVLSNVLSALFHFVLILVAVFYLLMDGSKLKRFLFKLSPLPTQEEELLVSKFKDVGRAIVVGNGVGSVLQGTVGGIGFAIVGLPSPVLWGTVMSIFAFLPLVGIGAVTVPAALYLAIDDRQGTALAFFLCVSALSFTIENVVKTRLIGSHMQMPDLLIFVAIIAGISTFGISGILYGPLIVTLFLTLAELYRTHYQSRFARAAEAALGVTTGEINLPKSDDQLK